MIPEQRLRAIAAADPVAVNYDTVREIAAELLAARAENHQLAKQRGELVNACAAKDDLLACYRIGKKPSEALFKRLDRAKKVLDAIAAEQPKPAGGGA